MSYGVIKPGGPLGNTRGLAVEVKNAGKVMEQQMVDSRENHV